MSAWERRCYTLTKQNRQWISSLIATAPDGCVVTVEPERRSNDQNAIFHALVGDIAKAKPEWSGMAMDTDSWKALLVVSHAIATDEGGSIRLMPDLEGRGLVQLRESTARMNKARATSLIDYTVAWATQHSIALTERLNEADSD